MSPAGFSACSGDLTQVQLCFHSECSSGGCSTKCEQPLGFRIKSMFVLFKKPVLIKHFVSLLTLIDQSIGYRFEWTCDGGAISSCPLFDLSFSCMILRILPRHATCFKLTVVTIHRLSHNSHRAGLHYSPYFLQSPPAITRA